MKRLSPKQNASLRLLVAKDIETAATIAKTNAKAAAHHTQAGRVDQAFRHILETEPALFDVSKLISVASYVKDLGQMDPK